MFAIGDYVIYGTTGVCKVEAIGKLSKPGFPEDVDYYTLAPFYVRGSVIYTPTEGTKVLMRPLLTKEEAELLIDGVPNLTPLVVDDEKRREEIYREMLRSGDLNRVISLLILLGRRRRERLAVGKKVTASDDKYFKLGEECLYGELSIAMDLPRDIIKAQILQHLNLEA